MNKQKTTAAGSAERLLNRNFTIILVGQIISLLGNNLLSFALPFYLLQVTGSGTVFGGVLAISTVPLIIGSPLGGVLADRVNRRTIMVGLDFFTFAIVAALAMVLNETRALVLITLIMLLLGLIKALYQPAVNASVPTAVAPAHLLKANSWVNMVSSVSSLLGPVLGGLLCSFLPIGIILAVCAVCFLAAAVMELFLRLPFPSAASGKPALALIRDDIVESVTYICREKPVIFKTIFFAAFINLFLTCFLLVGVPFLVNVTLNLSSQLYGYSQSAQGLGALVGGLLISLLAGKIQIQKIHLFLLLAGLTMVPLGLALMLALPALVIYATIVFGAAGVMLFGSMFSVMALTHIQQHTPPQLLGKVMSLTITISLCAQPLGQAAYGVLFDVVGSGIHWIVFAAVILTTVTAIRAKSAYQEMANI